MASRAREVPRGAPSARQTGSLTGLVVGQSWPCQVVVGERMNLHIVKSKFSLCFCTYLISVLFPVRQGHLQRASAVQQVSWQRQAVSHLDLPASPPASPSELYVVRLHPSPLAPGLRVCSDLAVFTCSAHPFSKVCKTKMSTYVSPSGTP